MDRALARRGRRVPCAAAFFVFAFALALAPLGAAAPPPAAPDRAEARPPAGQGIVNINTADLAELQLLPGIGPARARAILAQRRVQGVFLSVEELAQVPGIGPRSLQRLRPLCSVSGPTTARPARRRARRR